MSDEPKVTPTHSAAWHYEEAERCMSLASFMTHHETDNDARMVNPEVSTHLMARAKVHALLAVAGATVIASSPHSAARSQMTAHASGTGTREA